MDGHGKRELNPLKEKYLQGGPLNNMQGVNHIPKGFAHFPPMSIADHGVEENLQQGDSSANYLSPSSRITYSFCEC